MCESMRINANRLTAFELVVLIDGLANHRQFAAWALVVLEDRLLFAAIIVCIN